MHDNPSNSGIPKESKKMIKKYFKLKLKPKRILESLEEDDLFVPKASQFSN